MRFVWLLLAACSVPQPSAKDRAEPGRVYFGPAIVNAGPTITLCPDGRYTKTAIFDTDAADGPAGGRSVKGGMSCCTNAESGTYTFTRDARGTPVRVRFVPAPASPSTTAAPSYEEAISNDVLGGFQRGPRPPECR